MPSEAVDAGYIWTLLVLEVLAQQKPLAYSFQDSRTMSLEEDLKFMHAKLLRINIIQC